MSYVESGDLKPILVYNDPKEITPYSSIVVPSSMRSPLWKYFGFPADKNKQIITKNRIVCCICHAYIAYNKNTTNLSTHLNCKHPDVLAQLTSNKSKPNWEGAKVESPIRLKRDSSPPPKRSKMIEEIEVNWYADTDDPADPKEDIHPTGITEKVCVQGKRITYKSSDFKYNLKSNTHKSLDENLVLESEDNDNEQHIGTDDYSNIEFTEDGHEIITEVLDEATANNTSEPKDQYFTEEFLNNMSYDTPTKELSTPTKLPPKIANKIIAKRSHDTQEAVEHIKNFLIKDLVSPSIVDGFGFREMITYFWPSNELPSSAQIEKQIENDYNSQHSTAISDIKSIIDTQNYSLSFHKLGNSSMVEISVNYWKNNGNQVSTLNNAIFCISKNCSNFVLGIMDSLKMCSAFVADFDLKAELGTMHKEIPIIPTFSYVVKMAFDKCMELSAVRNAIDSAGDILLGKIKTAHTWIQQFEILLDFLGESTNTENHQIIHVLIECLQPLKNCIDVLTFESSAYASIMKPVASQLMSQHNDNDMEVDIDIAVLGNDIRRSIHQVFQEHIIENDFLTMASFLDPRFQRLTSPEDQKAIHDELERSVQNIEQKPAKTDKLTKVKSDKSFGLSSLFSNISTPMKIKPPKNRFDIEFRSYTEDVSLDMELCPMEWWAESESLYPTIKQNLKKYFCVPSFVNTAHRLPFNYQEELHVKYDAIGNDTDEKMLWLHLNELRQRSSESETN